MSAPLFTFVVTIKDMTYATVTVEAESEEVAHELALAEYRAEPEAYIDAGGCVHILQCIRQTGEAGQ